MTISCTMHSSLEKENSGLRTKGNKKSRRLKKLKKEKKKKGENLTLSHGKNKRILHTIILQNQMKIKPINDQQILFDQYILYRHVDMCNLFE